MGRILEPLMSQFIWPTVGSAFSLLVMWLNSQKKAKFTIFYFSVFLFFVTLLSFLCILRLTSITVFFYN